MSRDLGSSENRASNQLYVAEEVEVGGAKKTKSFGGFLLFDYIPLFYTVSWYEGNVATLWKTTIKRFPLLNEGNVF